MPCNWGHCASSCVRHWRSCSIAFQHHGDKVEALFSKLRSYSLKMGFSRVFQSLPCFTAVSSAVKRCLTKTYTTCFQLLLDGVSLQSTDWQENSSGNHVCHDPEECCPEGVCVDLNFLSIFDKIWQGGDQWKSNLGMPVYADRKWTEKRSENGNS